MVCSAFSISSSYAVCPDSDLGEVMDEMKTTFKEMRGALEDEDWETIVSMRMEMQKLTTASAEHKPLKLEKIPAEEQSQFLADYQEGLTLLETKLDELEAAVTTKDIELAKSIVEDIAKHNKSSHEKFKMKCD